MSAAGCMSNTVIGRIIHLPGVLPVNACSNVHPPLYKPPVVPVAFL